MKNKIHNKGLVVARNFYGKPRRGVFDKPAEEENHSIHGKDKHAVRTHGETAEYVSGQWEKQAKDQYQ